MASRTLTVTLLGDAKSALDAFDKTDKGAGNLTKTMGKLALGVGAAGVAVGAVALKFAGDFDKAYDTIRSGTGATGDVLEGLEDDFKGVLSSVPTDFGTASTAIADLNTRLGLTGEPLQEMSEQFINLARVTGGDVASSISAGTRLFGDWSVATEDQAGALDKMFRASQSTGIGVDALMQQVVTFGAPLRQMGFSLDESAALLGKWEKEGVNAEAILGALKIGVANFAKEGIDGREGLEQFVEQVTALGEGSEATSLAVETFGSRAGPDMAAAVLEGRFAIDDYLSAIEGGTDTINGVAGETDSWREKLTVLKNQGLVALEPAMTATFDGLTSLVDVISTRLVPWINDHLVPAFSVYVMPVLQAFGTLLTGTVIPIIRDRVVPLLRDFAEVARREFAKFQGYYETSIKPAIENIARLVEWVVGEIRERWPQIERIIRPVLEQVQLVVETVFGVVTGVLDAVIKLISGDFSGAWNAMKDVAATAMNGVQESVENGLQLLKGLLGLFFDLGKDLITGLWDGIKAIWELVTGWFGDLPGKAVAAVKKLTAPHLALLQIGKDIINGLWNGMKEIWNNVTGWLSGIGGAIQGLKGPIEKDRKLLVNQGAAIMQGLGRGMEEGFDSFVSPVLQHITDDIETTVAVASWRLDQQRPQPAVTTSRAEQLADAVLRWSPKQRKQFLGGTMGFAGPPDEFSAAPGAMSREDMIRIIREALLADGPRGRLELSDDLQIVGVP